ncbi:hypothetical protein RA19_15680 [Leisingera sp. ANG-M1]|uniref:hypothetical protein n=1 Tax=Leisingera sp. ANG-M1 TaxID=1577895 RepID=UPI00057C7632|nr:hypothetical protein [Leisingera sp. ANG-M1]KIC09452.1 hypothetical protein RA19_15680 [Leisingera sp. ANG-M1]
MPVFAKLDGVPGSSEGNEDRPSAPAWFDLDGSDEPLAFARGKAWIEPVPLADTDGHDPVIFTGLELAPAVNPDPEPASAAGQPDLFCPYEMAFTTVEYLIMG